MRIKKIKFDDAGEGVEPTHVTAEMTLEEVVWIAKNAGRQQGASPHNEIYSSLVGDVINRFWDGGLDDAYREYPVDLQPILKWDDVAVSKADLEEIVRELEDDVYEKEEFITVLKSLAQDG